MTERHQRTGTTAASVAITAVVLLLPATLLANEITSPAVATVDGQPITSADVDREIAIAFPNLDINPTVRAALREKTTEQLIRRQLVLRYLRDTKQSASQTEVDLAVERLKKQLAMREETFDEYLQLKRLDEPGLRRALAWQIGWSRLLAKYLTDANLQRYFELHRRDFDGTEIHVAHILFAVAESADDAVRATARKQAMDVLGQLRDGSLTFAAAAQRYSSGPSRDAGGDIGAISRHDPMPEPFSRAAFALELNQISEPVETKIGIHLIRCLEVTPGKKRWSDVRSELESAVTDYLFKWSADQSSPKAKIERLR